MLPLGVEVRMGYQMLFFKLYACHPAAVALSTLTVVPMKQLAPVGCTPSDMGMSLSVISGLKVVPSFEALSRYGSLAYSVLAVNGSKINVSPSRRLKVNALMPVGRVAL